ncbi:MAG: hypothetical protein ACUVWX_04600 [Kiritimatiellia bacterium]
MDQDIGSGRDLAFGSDEETKGRRGCLVRSVVVLAAVLFVLLGGVAVGVRTEGARTLIQDYLQKKLRTEISVRKCRMAFPYVFVMEDVRSGDFESQDRPGFRAGEVRLCWWPGERRMEVRQFDLRLRMNSRGEWEPAVAQGIGQLSTGSIAEVSTMVDSAVGKRTAVRAEHGNISWIGNGGNIRTVAEGVEFIALPTRLGEKKVIYFKLQVERLATAGQRECRGLKREWLASEQFDFIPLDAVEEDLPPVVRRFWCPSSSGGSER